MRRILTALLATFLLIPAGTAVADPGKPKREHGNGPERNEEASLVQEQVSAFSADRAAPAPLRRDRGYPRKTTLPIPPENPGDAAIKLGLTPYHAVAGKLNAIQALGDRVSAEIVGRSAGGRDLYLVTVTAPESAAEDWKQELGRRLIEEGHKPPRGYKAPVYVNSSIHGNEFEGVDAALRVIEELATSTAPDVVQMLKTTRLHFNVVANPDGRIVNTRANGNGFDLNRDMITVSQPEARVMRQIMIDTQPVAMIDLHGYVNGTLVEPTTPPHGANYEYDLFITNTWANGLNLESAINGLGYKPEPDGVLPVEIPFRDYVDGWDDWPPIFTPQYAPFHGAVIAQTIEVPLQVNNAAYTSLPVEELRRRSRINTDIHAAAIRGTYQHVGKNGAKLVADQVEWFRRGAAGEPSKVVPLGIVPGFGPEDVYNTTYPRAYVIPASGPAAARLVDFLAANDVRVGKALLPFRSGGSTHPAGTYVVDMRQPKRGLANVILERGADISPRVEAMYDISGWSHSLLWGAPVTPVTERLRVVAAPVAAASPTGHVPSGGGALALKVADGKDVQAVNDLIGRGVAVTWAGDGSAVVPASARAAAREVADRYGVRFTRAGTAGEGPVLTPVRITAAASADELFTLRELGFRVTPVNTALLNAGYDWSTTDVLYVSSGLSYAALNPAARAALDAYLASGGVVTRGNTGAAFNAAAGLLAATHVAGNPDGNGVVRMASGEHSFVYSPRWFTDLGPGVKAEQSYATDGPLVSGHWRATSAGAGGPEAARGQAAVISGRDERGAAVVVFGTEPLFRNHPKGLFAQVAGALYWTSVTSGQTVTR
ncbi:M14 family zinc carboxypeptidase [Nonomuraea sp. NPDC050328]|uniref:M14 family zinc carboxypeptidase n=1 Tax=Nonomuraea sp. NPDC050328 TaxID=3364361 RepID=UPI0037B35F14